MRKVNYSRCIVVVILVVAILYAIGIGFNHHAYIPLTLITSFFVCIFIYVYRNLRNDRLFDDLCNRYPNGIKYWASQRGLYNPSNQSLKNFGDKDKRDALKSESTIEDMEQNINAQYDVLESQITSIVLDRFIKRYNSDKYEIVSYQKEIEEAERKKKIDDKYNELRKKYPLGLTKYELDHPSWRGYTKEMIIEQEANISKYEGYARKVSVYEKWEKAQERFSDKIYELCEEVLPEYGIYPYQINYNRISYDGKVSTSEFKVFQFFAETMCIEKDVDFTLLPELHKRTLRLPTIQSNKKPFTCSLYTEIVDFIKGIGSKEDILVYYATDYSDWSWAEVRAKLKPFFDKLNGWFEYNVFRERLSTKLETLGKEWVKEEEKLKRFKGKYIVVLDIITENSKMKSTCKLIREFFPCHAPYICYISIIKCYDREEVEELLMPIKAHKDFIESVSSWDSFSNGVKYSYLFNYYPTTCDFEATEEEWANRRLVWNFKNDPDRISESEHQEALDEILDMVEEKLLDTFDSKSLKYLTLVCIPASTQVKTEARYDEFSERLCDSLGMINAYDYIEVIRDRVGAHEGGNGNDMNDLEFDESFFKGKYVLLFDDIITRGDSMRAMKRKLESLGATVVGGLSLGKTKHERPSC